jgi:protein phosphatase 1 regulatory subunit 11
VDNEGLGRKKSKVCCIYHKEHPVGESSDESSSDSEDSDSGDDGNARMVGGKRKAHGHEHDGCDHNHGKARKGKKKPSPNAYERMPKYDIKSLKQVDKTGT